MAEVGVSEARAILPEILDRVAAGEEVVISRHGKPAAVLLRPDAVRARRAEQTIARAREIGALLASAREEPLPAAVVPAERADELVEAVRTGRDRS